MGYNKDIEKVTSQRPVTVALQYSKVLTMFSFFPIVDFDIFVESNKSVSKARHFELVLGSIPLP